MRSASTPRWNDEKNTTGLSREESASTDASRRAVYSHSHSYGTGSGEADDEDEYWSSDEKDDLFYTADGHVTSPGELGYLSEGKEEEEEQKQRTREEKGKWKSEDEKDEIEIEHLEVLPYSQEATTTSAPSRKAKSEPVDHAPPPPSSWTGPGPRTRPLGPRPRQMRTQNQTPMRIPLPPPIPIPLTHTLSHRHTAHSNSLKSMNSMGTPTPPTAGTIGHSPHLSLAHSTSHDRNPTGTVASQEALHGHHSGHGHREGEEYPNEGDVTPDREPTSWLSSLARTFSLSTNRSHGTSHDQRPMNRMDSNTSPSGRPKRPAMIEWTSEPWLPIAAKFTEGPY